MIGCSSPEAWAVACLLGESSQQPTWPHSRQMRRCSQTLPIARQSSQPSTESGSSRTSTVSRWVQTGMTELLSGLGERQGDTERRPAGFRLERQRPAMAVDNDAPHGRKAQAGSVAGVLRGEERVEDVLAHVDRDARPVVGHLDDRAAALAARAERDRPPLADRLDRVVDEVGPYLVELGAADGELRQAAVVVAGDLDRRVLELVTEHDERRLDPLVEVDLDEAAAVHVGVR